MPVALDVSGFPFRYRWSAKKLTAEEGVDNVYADILALDGCSHRTSETEHCVFAGTVQWGGGNAHPGRLNVKASATDT